MKIEILIRYIEHYAKTGNIANELVPHYDQNGRWLDDSVPLSYFDRRSLLDKIRKSFLPESRRTMRGRLGTTLRTSCVFTGKNPITISYPKIDGDVLIHNGASVHASGLMRIGGRFRANNSTRIHLPQLMSVGGCFEAVHGYHIKAPRLIEVGGDLIMVCYVPPRIETVGGRFGAYWVTDLLVPRLRHIGGALVATKAEVVDAPVLEMIRGGLLLGSQARKLHAPCLLSVGGDFLAETVTDLRVPRLRAVGGDLDTRSAKEYYHPDVRVDGAWTICPEAKRNWILRETARQAMRGKSDPIYL